MMKEHPSSFDVESGYHDLHNGSPSSAALSTHRNRPATDICTLVLTLPNVILSTVTDCLQFNSKTVKMHSKTVLIGDLIAEGGYSFVFQATEKHSKEVFALKKILCQTTEQEKLAKNEIAIHRKFSHPSLLPLVDYTVTSTGGASVYFLLFPLYERGSLRKYIDNHIRTKRRIPEKEVLTLFKKVCEGVLVMHSFAPPYAHRDIKPENVLLSLDCQRCVLMDFGSVTLGNVTISSRSEALKLQDEAAQHSSMPYRAPELYDTPSQFEVTCKTDVWSLGCLLFAMAFGYSPFECVFTSDDRLEIVECSHLRVIGNWKFPKSCEYSTAFCDLVRWMLSQDPLRRPVVKDVIDQIERLLT